MNLHALAAISVIVFVAWHAHTATVHADDGGSKELLTMHKRRILMHLLPPSKLRQYVPINRKLYFESNRGEALRELQAKLRREREEANDINHLLQEKDGVMP